MERWTTVVRRGKGGRGAPQQNNREGRNREDAGTSGNHPERLEKRYFKLLQAIHHAEVIESTHQTNRFPAGMLRQVNKLT